MKSITGTIALVLLTMAFSVKAAEPVTGAFGFKFGEVLEQSAIIREVKYESGTVTYEVKPKIADDLFNRFEVEITPVYKKIHTIYATGKLQDKAAAESAANSIMEKLEQKYGPRAKQDDPTKPMIIRSGEGIVAVILSSKTPGQVRLAYSNPAIKKLGADESSVTKKEGGGAGPGDQSVDGAFGFKFGQQFDPAKALGTVKDSDGEVYYEVSAPSPNSYFDRYFISITPKTKKISSIWARGPVADAAEGRSRQQGLVKALEAKYELKRGIFDRDEANILIQNSKVIVVKSTRASDGGHVLQLIYTDSSITAQAKKEAAEVPAAIPDNKGL